jgi:hypothetical protein
MTYVPSEIWERIRRIPSDRLPTDLWETIQAVPVGPLCVTGCGLAAEPGDIYCAPCASAPDRSAWAGV